MTCLAETEDLRCVRPPKHEGPHWAYVLDEGDEDGKRRIEIVEFVLTHEH